VHEFQCGQRCEQPRVLRRALAWGGDLNRLCVVCGFPSTAHVLTLAVGCQLMSTTPTQLPGTLDGVAARESGGGGALSLFQQQRWLAPAAVALRS
jgi:hypothetical protein